MEDKRRQSNAQLRQKSNQMPQIAVKSRKHSYISRKSKQLEHSDNGYSSQSNTSIDKSARLPKLPSLARSMTPNSPLDPIEDLQDQVFFNEKEKRDKEFQKRFVLNGP